MSHPVDPAFRAALEHQLADLEAHPSSVYGLARDFRLAYLNPAWHAFAAQNGGQPAIGRDWQLGARYFDAIPEVLRPFYRDLFERAAARAGLHPITHAYECSSPAVERHFVMQVFTLPDEVGFLVVNSLRIEEPVERPGRAPDLAEYAAPDGLVRQCAHCRRTQNAKQHSRWDWIPAWVAAPLRSTSHTLCAICFLHYYPNGMLP